MAKVGVYSEKSCIVVLGSSGTGKTTTLNFVTGNTFKTGDDPHSITSEPTLALDTVEECGLPWIDTPGNTFKAKEQNFLYYDHFPIGWADTSGRSDEEAIKKVLVLLQKHEFDSIFAILWHVIPQPRVDSHIQMEASMIKRSVSHGKVGHGSFHHLTLTDFAAGRRRDFGRGFVDSIFILFLV